VRTETDIKKEIAAYLDSLGERCYHFPFHNVGYARKGIPDRIVCYRGRFLALEVKRPPEERKKNPEAEKWQERELSAINAAGGDAYVVWSVDQVRRAIMDIDHSVERDDANAELADRAFDAQCGS
jgi:hypothetical protein